MQPDWLSLELYIECTCSWQTPSVRTSLFFSFQYQRWIPRGPQRSSPIHPNLGLIVKKSPSKWAQRWPAYGWALRKNWASLNFIKPEMPLMDSDNSSQNTMKDKKLPDKQHMPSTRGSILKEMRWWNGEEGAIQIWSKEKIHIFHQDQVLSLEWCSAHQNWPESCAWLMGPRGQGVEVQVSLQSIPKQKEINVTHSATHGQASSTLAAVDIWDSIVDSVTWEYKAHIPTWPKNWNVSSWGLEW